MIAVLAVLLATIGPPSVTTQTSPAADLVDVTMGVCYGLAAGEIKLGGSLDEDNKALETRRIASGVKQVTMDRLGRQGLGFISQSIIGERASGEDLVVLAVGGRMPGCRSILLSKTVDGHDAKAAKLLVAAGWKEAPASNAPGAAVNRRMFIRRDAKGQPFLVNMFTGALAQSEFRVMTTVNAIPPGVELPQGF